jgi:hypothetical protein
MDLEKTAAERLAELECLRRLSEPHDPEADPSHDPRRADLIQRIAAGQFDNRPLTDIMTRVRRLFTEVAHVDGGHDVLLRLLLHVEKYGRLLIGMQGAGRMPRSQRNLVISGLSQLVLHHRHWIHPIADWRPTTNSPPAQFEQLATYLFARYPVPPCLNAVWFEHDPQEAVIQQGWYLHVCSGNNIRTASGLPFRLTRRAAHLFMTSIRRLHPLMALRVSQIQAIEAIDDKAHRNMEWAISSHERIYARENADFWTTILHFFLNNPMLEHNYVWPIVDYVHYTKFENRRIPQPDGSVEIALPAHPKFCLKARSIDKLVREVDNWHEQLSGGEYDHVEEWAPSGLDGIELTEDNDKLGARIHWTIQELRTSALLQVEGRLMHHCVGSYTRRCIAGEMSIWSLRSRQDEEDAEQHHVLTIAVDNEKRQVTQARGKFNLQPHGSKLKNKQRRTDSNYRVALRESARILSRWRAQEGLSYSQG